LFSDPHKTHKYIVWAEHGFLNIKPGGTYSDRWTLES